MKLLPLLALVALLSAAPARGQMVTGEKMGHFQEALGLGGSPSFDVTLLEAEPGGNVLFPGEQPKLTFLLTSHAGEAIEGAGKVEVIRYGTHGLPDDVWHPQVKALGAPVSQSITVSVPAGGAQVLEVQPSIPEELGGYALVLDLGPAGRRFATTCARTYAPAPERLQFPKLSLDAPVGLDVLRRLGVQAIRLEVGYIASSERDYARKMADLDAKLHQYAENNIAVLVTLGAGGPQPLGRGRPHLSPEGELLNTKQDLAWLPSADPDFQKFVTKLCEDYGWPTGPINAVQLWNEPWEGISISGWGADCLRYREIFTAMAQGVEEARAHGAQVLLAGCDSSSNTLDKLFSDGKETFLPWLDACTIHYQGPASPRIFRSWANRANGRVQIWDTESWVANSDDRVAPVIAGDRAFGYDRTMGVFWGNVSLETKKRVTMPDQTTRQVDSYGAWSTAAAVGAVQHFIGQRDFRELVFQNGLPWVMRFDGLKENAEDGTLVVVGDLGASFGADKLPFRAVKMEENRADSHTFTIDDHDGEFLLYDLYGNRLPAVDGKLTISLETRGFFLRTNGAPGSFDRLLSAVRSGRCDGYEPVEIVLHDLLAPVETNPELHATLTNVLNRPVTGVFGVSVFPLVGYRPGNASESHVSVTLAANETREIRLPLHGMQPSPDNSYQADASFNSGHDVSHPLSEILHVNSIAHRTIDVDGRLDDWKGVLPQIVSASKDHGRSAMEAAWLPFAKYDAAQKGGLATAYLAADDQYFYFAAKIAASAPTVGTLRFAQRDENASFYPAKSYGTNGEKAELLWPPGVRRYSYRERPPLPFGSAPKFDNVQIAFNVIPLEQKEAMRPNPPGTPPRFTAYQDTDYEYALNPVADGFGGGTEIWRCLVPGMVRKHFYPRQPASPFDGPVTEGKLVIRQDGNTRIVEAALPWTEIPLVKQARDTGHTVKFSFRVNSPETPGMELAEGRSVSRQNMYAFHPDWVDHWANEVEFAFEK